MRIKPAALESLSRDMFLEGRKLSKKRETRRFRMLLGASFKTIAKLWNMLEPKRNISRRAQPKHILWTMVCLKVSRTDKVHCTILKVKDEKTLRFWVEKFICGIASLETEVIVFGNRLQGWRGNTSCLMSIDGTDVKCKEPQPYNPIWWSLKHNSAGLRYEVGICIKTGDIVWFNGPFPCNMSDREIFDLCLSKKLAPFEKVEADNGYKGRAQIYLPGQGKNHRDRKQKSQVRGRHENVNGLFKVFGAMKKWESNNVAKHGIIAKAVAVIVQTSFSLGQRLYEVDYDVDYDN